MNHDVAARFGELAGQLYDAGSVDELMQAVIRFAPSMVGCAHASIVLVDTGGALDPIVASDPVMEKADQLQLEFGQGPWLSAMSGHDTVEVTDTVAEPRWQRWTPKAADLGLRSLLSIRLHTGGPSLGALNLASDDPGAFEPHATTVAHILARHVCVAVATAQQKAALWQAIDTQQVIAQAQGLLMERHGLNTIQASAALRHESQNAGLTLRDVAQHLIDARTVFTGRSAESCSKPCPPHPVQPIEAVSSGC